MENTKRKEGTRGSASNRSGSSKIGAQFMKFRISHLLLLFSVLAALAGPVIGQDRDERIEIIKVGGNLDRSVLGSAAPIGAAAPGVSIGHAQPVVAGGPPSGPGLSGPIQALASDSFEVSEPTPDGLIDIVAPSISNLLVELEGTSVVVRGQSQTFRTLRATEDGTAAIRTVFYEPPLGVGILRLATGVEAAFFFLVVGLAVAAFEFYALGPGIASAVAAVMLLIGGYGLTVLPFRGWALGLTLLGLGLLTADFQKGRTGLLSALGASALVVGGLFFRRRPSDPAFLVDRGHHCHFGGGVLCGGDADRGSGPVLYPNFGPFPLDWPAWSGHQPI